MSSEIVNFFLDHLRIERRLSAHSIKAYTQDLTQFQEYQAASLSQLEMAQAKHVRQWLVWLSEQDIENKSINRKMAALRSFFRWAQSQGKIKENPMSAIRSLKTPKNIPHFVREKEMEQILDLPQAHDFPSHRDQLILLLLYGTGIRLSELIQLKRADIHWEKATIKVLGKRNKERILPLPLGLLERIQAYLTLCPYEHELLLLNDQGKPLYPVLVQRKVKAMLAGRTQSEQQSPHVLRHSYASHLLERGADLNAIKELMGHANLAATQIYTHQSLDKMKSIYRQAHPKGGKKA